MSERLLPADVALARRLRALEDAHDQTLRASADLLATMLDARAAHRLPAYRCHDDLARVAGIISGTVALRGQSVDAHGQVARLGRELGLPITAVGDVCQDAFTSAGHQGREAA